MTTTTRIASITVTLLESNLISDGAPTRAAVQRLAQETAAALSAEFPGATVAVPVQWNTSGVTPNHRIVCADSSEQTSAEVEALVEHVAGQTWERWASGLTDADVVV